MMSPNSILLIPICENIAYLPRGLHCFHLAAAIKRDTSEDRDESGLF